MHVILQLYVAFWKNIRGMIKVIIPDGVTTIDDVAFYQTRVVKVTIP